MIKETEMTRALAICAAAAFMMLAGCAYDYDDGYGPTAEIGVGAPIWYDDYYGPYYDGYWGPEGAFYFSEGPGRPFRRDADGHFRREGGAGFHAVMGGGREHRG
jgi:hypothetical protein